MTVSNVGICNIALAKLGARPIASLDENSQAARYCKTFFEVSRDAVLRDYDWNFASFNASLSNIVVPDGYDKWSYAYGYPQDCLKVRALHDNGGNNYSYEINAYLVEGVKRRIILTELENAYANYTVKISNPELFNAQFIDAFALNLAKELAFPVTKDNKLEQIMFQKYQMAIPRVQASDAQEEYSRDEYDTIFGTEDPWISART